MQYKDNPPVILPKVGNMPAPFTQGGLWLVRYTNLTDKSEFDIYANILYNIPSFIRQFVTILSVNKTRESRGVAGA